MEVYTIINIGANDFHVSKQALLELISLHHALEDVFAMHFAKFGLSWPKFNLLIHLYMAGDQGLIQSELSKKLVVSRANITSLIERLERDNLVLRTSDSTDKRVYRIKLTNRAVALMNSLLPIHNEYTHKVMSALDKEELELLTSLLVKLNKGLCKKKGVVSK